jgi:hypothetical protein
MLKHKAVENLAAGDLLLARGYVNAAASRFYYAMYQAAVQRLRDLGRTPSSVPSGAVEWDHSMVQNNTRLLRDEWRDHMLFRTMRILRVDADYEADAVLVEKVRERRSAVADFVKELTR